MAIAGGQTVVAIHEIVEIERPRDDGARRGTPKQGRRPRSRRGSGPASATANHSAAQAWTNRRTPTPSARTSSRSETSASASQGTSHWAVPASATGANHNATGSQPAQIASPPPRGSGAACSERSLGTSCGRPARARNRATTVSPPATSANATPANGRRPIRRQTHKDLPRRRVQSGRPEAETLFKNNVHERFDPGPAKRPKGYPKPQKCTISGTKAPKLRQLKGLLFSIMMLRQRLH